jgi:hypothetical protein
MTEKDYLIDGEPMPAADAPERAPSNGLIAEQPTAVIGAAVTVAEAIIATALPLPEWLKLILGGIVALGGVLGIRSKVTPVAKPRLDADTPLTP